MAPNPKREVTYQLLHVHDCAERLGVSVYTVRAWLRQRRLGFVRCGRRVLVPDAEVERFIRENTVSARGGV